MWYGCIQQRIQSQTEILGSKYFHNLPKSHDIAVCFMFRSDCVKASKLDNSNPVNDKSSTNNLIRPESFSMESGQGLILALPKAPLPYPALNTRSHHNEKSSQSMNSMIRIS